MATFSDYTTAEKALEAVRAYGTKFVTAHTLPAKIADAETEVFKALKAFDAAVGKLQPFFDKVADFNEDNCAYSKAFALHERADRDFRAWKDIRRRFEAGEFHLQEQANNEPPRPESFAVPKKPEPLGRDFGLQFLSEYKGVLSLAKEVKAKALALDALLQSKAEAESEGFFLQSAFIKQIGNIDSLICSYEQEDIAERKAIEEELASLATADAENAKRRDELKSKLSFMGKIANALKV